MGLRFQKRISLLPGVRLNLSKSGVSASLGPRGADVNIGPHGVTTNAGIPGTGISYRQKLGAGKSKGGWLGILAVVAGLGVWVFQHHDKMEKTLAAAAPGASAPSQTPVNMAPASVRYVHRSGSVIRSEPKTSAELLKKEAKGVPVTLLSEQDGWAKVTDGQITGYMRASVLGVNPPR